MNNGSAASVHDALALHDRRRQHGADRHSGGQHHGEQADDAEADGSDESKNQTVRFSLLLYYQKITRSICFPTT